MALTLPYPDMNFVPLDILTAAEQNQLVANIEYIADNTAESSQVFATSRRRIYVDGTNGNNNNDGLSTATPKKTLGGCFDVMNKYGGSAEIRFLTAGTYNHSGGQFDGANVSFQKNASSIGDVIINLTGTWHFENSVVQYNNIIMAQSSSTMNYYNCYTQFSTCEVRCQTAFYGSSVYILTNCLFGNRMTVSHGSSITMSGLIVDYEGTESANFNMIQINRGSKISIFGNIVLEENAANQYLNLFLFENMAIVAIANSATITDNTTTKPRRIFNFSSSIVNAQQSILDAFDIGTASNTFTQTLKILGNATVGA